MPADSYAGAAGGDLWVVFCHFNPVGYRTRPANLERFLRPFAGGRLPWMAVECVFGEGPFALPEGGNILRVRGRDVMWHKERLLNHAISRLPPQVRKVAWVDADVLFCDPEWAARASRELESVPVLQPFSDIVRLPRGTDRHPGGDEGEVWRGFADVFRREPDAVLTGDFARHGHTGFAWAARRDWLETNGLYDCCITGSADHLMAHAFVGDWDGPCVRRVFARNAAHHRHFAEWCKRVYPSVRARVGCVPGGLLHLWHGETADRKYVDRNRELAAFRFDPVRDLRPAPDGSPCWEWAADRPALRQWATEYFRKRREDGEQTNAEVRVMNDE
jgi:hypothetical protein